MRLGDSPPTARLTANPTPRNTMANSINTSRKPATDRQAGLIAEYEEALSTVQSEKAKADKIKEKAAPHEEAAAAAQATADKLAEKIEKALNGANSRTLPDGRWLDCTFTRTPAKKIDVAACTRIQKEKYTRKIKIVDPPKGSTD